MDPLIAPAGRKYNAENGVALLWQKSRNRPIQSAELSIDLKDPGVAAILAWLVPGLGHWYQGRRAKAVLYFVAIVGMFGWGIYLGGSGESFDRDGRTSRSATAGRSTSLGVPMITDFYYLAQVFVGLPALPAVPGPPDGAGTEGALGRIHGPADCRRGRTRTVKNADQPTADELNKHLNRYFDLATFYATVAGLLNVLAIYNAWAGPVVVKPAKKER